MILYGACFDLFVSWHNAWILRSTINLFFRRPIKKKENFNSFFTLPCSWKENNITGAIPHRKTLKNDWKPATNHRELFLTPSTHIELSMSRKQGRLHLSNTRMIMNVLFLLKGLWMHPLVVSVSWIIYLPRVVEIISSFISWRYCNFFPIHSKNISIMYIKYCQFLMMLTSRFLHLNVTLLLERLSSLFISLLLPLLNRRQRTSGYSWYSISSYFITSESFSR